MKFQRSLLRSAVVAPLLVLASVQMGVAQDWKKQWEDTVAAARAEGEVVVATSPNQIRREFLQREWSKEFPGIKLNLTSVRGSTFNAQVATERSAGKFLWDAFQSGPSSAILAAREGFYDPLLPELILPEVKDPEIWGGWETAFYDDKKESVLATIGDVLGPYYNADMLSPDRVKAEGLKVLLDPQFKGKIVWYDPRLEGPGGLFLPLFERELGKDGLRKLVIDQDPVFVDNYHAVAEAIVRGKAAIAIAGKPSADLKEFTDAGVKVNVQTFGKGPKVAFQNTAGSVVAVFNNRPHPNAARVFTNWFLTKRIQDEISKATMFNTRRSDVAPVDPNSAAEGRGYTEPQRSVDEVQAMRDQIKQWRPQ